MWRDKAVRLEAQKKVSSSSHQQRPTSAIEVTRIALSPVLAAAAAAGGAAAPAVEATVAVDKGGAASAVEETAVAVEGVWGRTSSRSGRSRG